MILGKLLEFENYWKLAFSIPLLLVSAIMEHQTALAQPAEQSIQQAAEASAATQTPSPQQTPSAEVILPIAPDTLLAPFREKLQANYFPPYVEKTYQKYIDGDYEKVASEIENIEQEATFSKRRPLPERALLLKGLAFISTNSLDRAEAALKTGLTLKGSNAEVLYVLGIIFSARADFKSALQYFSETAWYGKGVVASPDLAQFALGLVYRRQKDNIKSLAAYNAALALNPNLLAARLEIASLSLETGDKPQAIIQLREVLAKNPSAFQAHVYLARALLTHADRLLNRRDIAEATQIMSDLLKPKDLTKDQFLEALPVFVDAQLASGDLAAAEKVVTAALKRDPQSAAILQLRDQIDLERKARGTPS